MISFVCVLGRQPAIGLAELESLYGSESVVLISPQVAGLNTDTVDFARLGGSTRLGSVLTVLLTSDWKLVEKELQKIVRSAAFAVPASGKFHLGISAYGLGLSTAKLNASALTLKKIIRTRGVSVRVVPNNEPELSTAQVYHSHLADQNGAELLVIRTDDHKTLIARTVAVQNIDSYTLRDRGRPKRDARVGMLPPKLAQQIINLAVGQVTVRHESRDMSQEKTTVLDPFCGTGVVLQEALLMGYDAYGTDLEPRMVSYTQENIDWLASKFDIPDAELEVGDATTHKWQNSRFHIPGSKVVVACETYLGRPFTDAPNHAVLEQTVTDVNGILKKFLANIHPQLAPGSRLCLAVPAWFVGKTPRHLPVLDSLESLGFIRVQFQHAHTEDLIYHRENQIVGRELVTLVRK